MSTPQVTYYVVISRQPPDIGGSIRPIARLLKEDESLVREKLMTQTYEVLSRFAKRANADGMRGQLHALGVESAILSDQDIRGYLYIFAAAASKGEGGMALRDFAEKPLYCPFDDITNVLSMEVYCEDGSRTTLIDLHRKSSPIVPRLDVSLFDFPSILGKEDAKLEDFLAMLEERAEVKVDKRFAMHRPQLVSMTRDFGSLPGMFEPPTAALVSPYTKDDIRAANMYSTLVHKFAAQRTQS